MTEVSTRVAFANLPSLVGKHIGETDWRPITQERINLFADATDDHQWIHVDVERAKTGPFGGPIAHGYLTLSLGASFVMEVLDVEDASAIINYGLGKVRFVNPVPVGSRVRGSVDCIGIDEVAGAYQGAFSVVTQIEGVEKPACVADTLLRYYGPAQ